MTRPDDGPASPADGSTEPGHRARAYAAALLGELTGGRRTGGLGGGSGAPSDPSSPSAVPDLSAATLAGERDAAARAGEPLLDAPVEGEHDAPASSAEPADAGAALEEPDGELAVVDAGGDPADDADAGGTGSGSADGRTFADEPEAGLPADPATGLREQDAAGAAAAGTADERPAASGTGYPTSASTAAPTAAPTSATASAPASPPTTAASTAASTATTTTGDVPGTSALVGTPVRGDAVVDRLAATAPPQTGPRPAPFTYVEVAAHHTAPARTRATGALDGAGPQITSRADREQVRRAARTAVAAAALLDACDALDDRARSLDGTWDGERHGATEVREFERSWTAFYDTSSALSASA